MTTQEIYDRTIKSLPPAQRLELATLILGDIPPQALVDYRTEWSDEDMEDLNRASWDAIDSAEECSDHA
jgi:hypothetical protein